jgi:hypothetical protein
VQSLLCVTRPGSVAFSLNLNSGTLFDVRRYD